MTDKIEGFAKLHIFENAIAFHAAASSDADYNTAHAVKNLGVLKDSKGYELRFIEIPQHIKDLDLHTDNYGYSAIRFVNPMDIDDDESYTFTVTRGEEIVEGYKIAAPTKLLPDEITVEQYNSLPSSGIKNKYREVTKTVEKEIFKSDVEIIEHHRPIVSKNRVMSVFTDSYRGNKHQRIFENLFDKKFMKNPMSRYHYYSSIPAHSLSFQLNEAIPKFNMSTGEIFNVIESMIRIHNSDWVSVTSSHSMTLGKSELKIRFHKEAWTVRTKRRTLLKSNGRPYADGRTELVVNEPEVGAVLTLISKDWALSLARNASITVELSREFDSFEELIDYCAEIIDEATKGFIKIEKD